MTTTGAGYLIREMANRGLWIVAGPPDWAYRIEVRTESHTTLIQGYCAGTEDQRTWESVADSLVEVIKDHDWLFRWGVYGKLSGHDWLQCNSCDELQLLPKAKGAPSQKPKCHMTLTCTGTYRRMPEIFDVTKPKKPRLTKVQKAALELRDLALVLEVPDAA